MAVPMLYALVPAAMYPINSPCIAPSFLAMMEALLTLETLHEKGQFGCRGDRRTANRMGVAC